VAPTSDDGSVTADGIFGQWGKNLLEAGDKCGKGFRINERVKDCLKVAGFEDLVELTYKLPIGPWNEYPRVREIGRWNLVQWQEGIEDWSLALLTRALHVKSPLQRSRLLKLTAV
jgi:hypothetical protein